MKYHNRMALVLEYRRRAARSIHWTAVGDDAVPAYRQPARCCAWPDARAKPNSQGYQAIEYAVTGCAERKGGLGSSGNRVDRDEATREDR